MITSPYKLNIRADNPVQFYDDLAEFTGKVLLNGTKTLENLINDYIEFSRVKNFKIRQQNEYVAELLMAGIFWKNYNKYLSIDALFFHPLFNQLYKIRKKYKSLKKRVDNYRGQLAYKILATEKNKEFPIYERLEYLLHWLDCTKEFNQEVERLSNWKLFLENKHVDYQHEFWTKVEKFTHWFEFEAENHLGKYTRTWIDFRLSTINNYKGKENFFFCTRQPNEYHLNMVAAEIMNQTLRPAFHQTKNKIVLLPTCMTKSNSCKAELVDNQLKCMHCTESCNVSKLTTNLNKRGIKTVLIPHSSGFSKFLKPWENSTDTGLVGVACTLNLITGGYEMQKLNIPSQCVFLDTCGCKKHWVTGNPTHLNEKQLDNLLLNERIKQPAYSSC